MASITYTELQQYSKTRSVTESLIYKALARIRSDKIVFLSYSSKDSDYIEEVIAFFSKPKAPVYIDCGDEALPNPPTPKTAEILKDAIKSCPRFALLLSGNSKNSQWVPWELGLADGLKGVAPVALFTLGNTSQEEEWERQEYLGLYPRITKGFTSWRVHDPRNDSHWDLDQWLHQSVT